MVLALACKAVGTVEVACVGNVEAQSLDLEVLLSEVLGQVLVFVGSVELTDCLKVIYVGDAFLGIHFCNAVLFDSFGNNSIGGLILIPLDHVIGDLVDHVNRTRIAVEHDVQTFKLITVDHLKLPFT